jgi:hypothetical protein
MTLSSIEREFNEILMSSAKTDSSYDLTLNAPLFTRDHPKVLWARLQHVHNSYLDMPADCFGEWSFRGFPSLEEAKNAFPNIEKCFYGQPWAVNNFLASKDNQAIIDFASLGVAVLSRYQLSGPSVNSLQRRLLAAWLPYAVSPELWGPVGKWNRFHTTLHDLFNKHNLLLEGDCAGYYPLKSKAQILSRYGFIGSSLDKSYVLVLPWTFSLSGVRKLEKIVQQEL